MKAATAKTRIQFRNILFATDFSPAAMRAIPIAKAIARNYDSNIVALHVRGPVVNPMTPPAVWPMVLEAEKQKDELRRGELLSYFAGIPAAARIEEGDILSHLAEAIKNDNVDLVVVGTHGRTGFGKLILGSVAEEILRTVHCPVLTVGPNSSPAWATGTTIREVLFATDFSPESREAAAYAVSLAQEFQARLVLLHVVANPEAGDLVSPANVTAASENLLRQFLPEDAELWCKPEFIVAHGKSAEMILEIAKQRESDLIVLGARPESGVRGASTHLPIATVHKVVTHANCPVLTVRYD
jgi:nucleotide-binding universal stress UspA family protein